MLSRVIQSPKERVTPAAESATVISVFDLCYLDDSGYAKPASDQADTETEAGNQEAFANAFLGVALRPKIAGQTEVEVAIDGVFEFDCAAATFELGDLVGVDEAASGTALTNQTVVAVAEAKLAIGRVARREPTETTRVRVQIVSVIFAGGAEAQSYTVA